MFSIKSQSGNTILMMLVMIAGLSLATIAMFGSSQVYDSSGTRFLARQKALYTSDGTRAFAIQLTQDYLKEFPQATNDDVKKYLDIAIPPLLPSGYSVSDITVDMTSMGSAIIPNGTFKGMVAPQVQVKFSYTISKGVSDAENKISHHFDAVVTLAQVGLHQFMYFVDLESAGFSPGQPTTVNGRVHANGDLCIAGQNGLTFSKITAAGRLMHSRRTACGANFQNFSLLKTFIASGSDLTSPKPFGLGSADNTRNDNGCINCLNSGTNWVDYALTNWNGNVQDVDQKVPKLALPVPSDVKAQVGANGPNPYIGYSNSKNLRFLVDPVITGEPDTVKKMKYSYNSDVRIIDGVWYVRDPADPTGWPGKPVWSDHPGKFKDAFLKDVGQEDLNSDRGWGGVIPKGYSYYGYDKSAKTLIGSATGTISYGTLARKVTGSGPRWFPGHLVNKPRLDAGLQSAADFLCEKPSGTGTTTFSPAIVSRRVLAYDDTSTDCAPPSSAIPEATALLNGTRSGINDPHVAWYSQIFYEAFPHSSTIPDDRARILPTNFDVEHFQAALKNTGVGELGSYFTHNGSKTDFNGILYITTTWPGSNDGYTPRNAPSPWPVQNDGGFNTYLAQGSPPSRAGDTNQIKLTADEQQRSLPYQLCSTSENGNEFDKAGGINRFKIPKCGDYATSYPPISGTLSAFPNAIRIHNGANIDTTLFKKGLSIVSNMPVYVLGSYNANSNVTSATSAPWIPALIAGDQITIMSNNWDDANDPFAISGVPAGTARSAVSRQASDTSYSVSFISGWAMHSPHSISPSASNEAIHSMPALIEDWYTSGARMTLTGSIAIGYYPVFYRGGRYYYSDFANGSGAFSSYNYATYYAGPKTINYDKHLEQIAKPTTGFAGFLHVECSELED